MHPGDSLQITVKRLGLAGMVIPPGHFRCIINRSSGVDLRGEKDTCPRLSQTKQQIEGTNARAFERPRDGEQSMYIQRYA